MNRLLAEFGNTFTFVKKGEVVCNFCSRNLIIRNKQCLRVHVKTKKHMGNVSGTSNKNFFDDLCETFVSANIPFTKINNPVFKKIIKKYTGRDLPDESTIRKYYVQGQYDKTITTIKSKLSDKYIWVSADETTDIKGRCVVNVVVGLLDPQDLYKPYLISTQFRCTVKAEEICTIVNDAIKKVGITDATKVLLFVSDAAAIMLKVGKLLKQHFSNILHLTCFAHAIHRICEFIREEFPDVNTLISTCKKILLKAPSRLSLYKENCPNLPLPPQPIITRWGTWLEAAIFYARNFDVIKSFVLNLPDEAVSIKDCKKVLLLQDLHEQLKFIDTNFAQVLPTIKFLEQQNIELASSFQRIESLYERLRSIEAPISKKLQQKIDAVVHRNPDFHILKQISANSFTDEGISQKYSNLVSVYSFAPVTSCDVERSFSRFKDILTSKRNNFTEDNFEKYAVIQSFNAYQRNE